jgi:hypothetical protein
MPNFDVIQSAATNAVNSAKNTLTNSGLASNLSATVTQTAGQIAGAANKVAGQVSNLIRDPLGAFNVDITKLLKAPSMLAKAAGDIPAPPYPNILNIFSSYTYIFTLSALPDNSINNPDSTYRAGIPQFIIAKSAAGSPDNRIETDYGKFDFFIDNVNIESIVGFDKNTGNSSATSLNFTVTEPYSMGLFMESVAIAADQAGQPSYVECPFLFQIDFKGFTEQNETVDLPQLRKYFPIKFREVVMKVTGKGATYQVQCIIWNDGAFSDNYTKNKTDISISGKTVQEVLQTGEKSLQKVLNDYQAKLVKDKVLATADQILILFPQEIASSATPNSSGSDATPEDSTPATADTSKANASSTLFEKLGVTQVTTSAGTNVVQNTDACNAVGQSSMGFNLERKGDPSYGKENKAYDETSGTYIRGEVDSQQDPAMSEFKFRQDTDVMNSINQVILQSNYAQQALKGNMIDDKGFLPWWRIETQFYQISDDSNLAKTGQKPKIVVYRVVPYKVHSGKFMPANVPAPGFEELKKQAIKEYNYIYTGKNLDVLDFDITIQNSFFQKFAADGGNNSQDIKMQAEQGSQDATDTELPPLDGEKTVVTGSTGSKTLPVGLQTSTDKLGGGGSENSATRRARQFHEALSEGADMIEVDMKIMGDPYYLGDSGMGNYTAKNETGYDNINNDGAIDYQSSEVDIIVNFKTPVDINQSAGMYDFASDKLLLNFSGLYKVQTCSTNFSSGKFTQTLHLLRRGLQEAAELNKELAAKARTKFPGTETVPDNDLLDWYG